MLNKLQRAYSLVFPRKQTVIRREPTGNSRGCVSISYITWPFVEGFDAPKARGHTNAYEVIVMAEAYRDLGFRVEVVDWDHATYAPPADCRIAIDIHSNLERWQDGLPANCLRILHATGPH